jgi:hypothetical protein
MEALIHWAQVPWACAATLLVTGTACVLLAMRDELDAYADFADFADPDCAPLPDGPAKPPSDLGVASPSRVGFSGAGAD